MIYLQIFIFQNGLDLIHLSVHPTLIISGYRLALKECISYIRKNLLISADLITDEVLVNVAKVFYFFQFSKQTTLSSKILGAETEKFSKMAVDAVKAIGKRSE